MTSAERTHRHRQLHGAAIDPMTREGAEALARKLNRYWHAQGHPQVRHWVEEQRWLSRRAPRFGEEIWVVRSNLVRGMPPRSTDGTGND